MFYQNQHFGISDYFCKETGENFSFPMHMHHSFEMIAILDGGMTVQIGNASYELRAGEGVLIFPDQIHCLESRSSRHLLIIFSPALVSAYHAKRLSQIPRCSKITIPPYLISLLSELEKGSSVFKIKAVTYAICALLDESTDYVKRRPTENGLLGDILHFVENNADKDCTLAELGASLGYNPSYLSRYFSEVTGLSFIAYVNRYRVSRACHLLGNTDKTILACAEECGYRSLRSFNRNFKEITGSTPQEYRRRSTED